MKRYLFLFIIGFTATTGCGNASGNTGIDTSASEPVEETKKAAKKSIAEGATIKMTKEDFLARVMDYESNPEEWVYKGDKPCLIDFYADWCGPCRTAAPILEELAAEYKDEIYIYKVDTEAERELSSVFGIRSIPAFLFVPKNGKPTMSNGIARTPEATKEMFRKMIDEILLEKVETES